jgi:hypothetical protein
MMFQMPNKAKSIFPTPEAAPRLLFLDNRNILKKWTMPIPDWPLIPNQPVIRFESRLAIYIVFRLHNALDNPCWPSALSGAQVVGGKTGPRSKPACVNTPTNNAVLSIADIILRTNYSGCTCPAGRFWSPSP